MKHYIYCATNNINGKSYVGQSIDPDKRWKDHINDAMRDADYRRYAFQNAIRKYGSDNFTWKIISECNSLEEANTAEEFFIENLNTLAPNGYNLNSGGGNSSPSEETRKKISETLKITSSFIGKKGKDHPNFQRNYSEEEREKARQRFGGDNSLVKKITSVIAVNIYMDGLNTKLNLRELSLKYGITRGAINNILHKRSWPKVTANLPDINFDKNDPNSRGNAIPNNSTSIETAKQILEDFKTSDLNMKSFSKENSEKYQVKPSTICDILSGRSFKRYLT